MYRYTIAVYVIIIILRITNDNATRETDIFCIAPYHTPTWCAYVLLWMRTYEVKDIVKAQNIIYLR